MSEQDQIHKVFDNVQAHLRIADLIRRFSTNRHDVRRMALEGLDLKECRQILDLGCAFGSFTEKLKGRVSPEAIATGVDSIGTYEPLYLTACRRAGIGGRFFSTGTSILETFADRSFDLILCSYALYFFPEVIPQIARLLHPKGTFVAITHHRQNAGEMIELIKGILDAIGLSHERALPLESITARFSAENGKALLQPWFGKIDEIDFPNRLAFPKRDIGYVLEYFRFKSPLYFTDTGLDLEAVIPVISAHIRRAATRQKNFTISKDDCIFVCTLPRRRTGKAMKKGKRQFCHVCGGPVSVKEEEGINRDFCPACNLIFYENPLPVVSAIVAEDRRVLLVKRGKSPYKGSWCLPTGFAETGESIEEAALRELEEETGVKGRILSLTDVQSYKSRFYGDLLFISYEVEQTGGTLQPGSDTVAARYFPVGRLPRLAFPSNRDAMRSYMKSKSDYWSIVDSFSITLGKESPKDIKKNLLSDKLVEVIEKNAKSIAQRWLKDILANPSTAGYRRLEPSRLLEEILGILSQFGKWMGGFYKDSDIRDYYTAFGVESRRNGVPLSHVLSALSLIKKHLWEFALSRGMWRKTIDIYMALELDRRIVIFFDKAVFYTTQGHEAGTPVR